MAFSDDERYQAEERAMRSRSSRSKSYFPASTYTGNFRTDMSQRALREAPASNPQKRWSYFLDYMPDQQQFARPQSQWGTPISTPLPRSQLTTYRLPYGGTTTVPTRGATPVVGGVELTRPPIQKTSEQIYAEGYAKGYGPPNQPAPQIVEGTGGAYLSQGGIMTPVENLTPAQRTANLTFGQQFGQNLRSGGLLGSALYGLGTLGYNAYKSLFSPANVRSASQYGQTLGNPESVYNSTVPTGQPSYGYNPYYNQPRRYFDE